MKRFFYFAASLTASFAFLAPAVSAQPAGDGAQPAQASGAMYCWKDKLQVTNTAFVCNWADSAAEACKGNPTSDISKDSVTAEPGDARRCNNGKWLVQVTKK